MRQRRAGGDGELGGFFRLTDEQADQVKTALLDQVHHIAHKYGWTEREILRLPSWKRIEYAERVNKLIEADNKRYAAMAGRR